MSTSSDKKRRGPLAAAVIAAAVIFFSAASLWAPLATSLGLKTDGQPTDGSPSTPPPGVAIGDLKGILAYQALLQFGKDVGSNLSSLGEMAEREDGAGYQARLLMARHYVSQSAFKQAAEAFKQALALRKDAEPKTLAPIRSELAAALERSGDPTGALAEWALVLPQSPAVAAIKRLAVDPVDLAQSYVSARLYQEALQALAADTRPAAELVRARALSGLARVPYAIRAMELYLRSYPGDLRAQTEYAAFLERGGRYTQALKQYASLGADGYAGQGRVLQAIGRPLDAVDMYLKSTSADAKRRAGLILEEAGDHSRALEVFASVARADGLFNQECLLRALAICDRLGNSAARAELEPLLGPGAAWMRGKTATPRLDATVSTVSATSAASEADPIVAPPVPEAVATAQALLKMLGTEPGVELARIEVEVALNNADPETTIALAGWLSKNGDPRLGVRVGTRLLKATKTRSVYELLYPKAFEPLVLQYGKEFGVDPMLVWGIIREESAYEADVVSWAGAIGLMQIMPSTGKSIGTTLGAKITPKDLTDPSINVRFGSWYIKQLLGDFGGQVPRALAAYNAGASNSRRWAGTALGRDNATFIEAITFMETRGYVIRVIDSWRTYHWLYGATGGK